jgi:endonuclease/exonuclease/phosphatase family metal-dependent hydrolase
MTDIHHLPSPGQLVYLDCRPKTTDDTNAPSTQNDSQRPLKCVQWNIERAYKLDAIIQLLLSLDADIICLQELDIGCERSSLRNSFLEITLALKMFGVFGCEFEEIKSRMRSKKTQGGGVHGNAILSKFDLSNCELIPHTMAFDWEKKGGRLKEPRRGRRYAVAADVIVHPLLTIRVYSLHLELYCGIRARVAQYKDVLEDSLHSPHPHQLIFGDFNTMAHGLARLFPSYCSDGLRYGSLGMSEADWWYRNVLCSSTLNNHFFDPFDRQKDYTLWQANGWFYRGKLDWTLCRAFFVTDFGMHNARFTASDHRLLWVSLKPSDDATKPYQQYLLVQKEMSSLRSRLLGLCIFLAAMLCALLLTP